MVWETQTTQGIDLFGYDLSTNTKFVVAQDPGDQEQPSVSGNLVVWEDTRNSNNKQHDIYGFDLTAHHEFIISSHGGDEVTPKVSGEIVVWADYIGSTI